MNDPQTRQKSQCEFFKYTNSSIYFVLFVIQMLEHWVFFDAACVRKREEIDYNSLKHGLLSIKVCHLHY